MSDDDEETPEDISPDLTPVDDEAESDAERLKKHPLWPKFISDFFNPKPKN
jgi:hypothetical protein